MPLTAEQREQVKRRLRRLREKNGVRTLDPVKPASSYEVAYYREIVRPVEGLSQMVERDLLPLLERYESEYAVENGRFLFVASSEIERIIRGQLNAFDSYVDGFGSFAVRTAERFTRSNDDYHYRKFVQGVNKQFGINIADQMTEYGVTPILRKVTKDNVDLIVDLPKQYYEKINKVVFEGLTSGNDFTSIRSQLENLEGISKRRAKLIAVDQTGKLIGALNKQRQRNEGITRYQWDANLDSRTRPRHVENDGKVFEWTDTSPGKAFGPPGQEVRCRCTGRGVIDEGVLAGRNTRPEVPRIPTIKPERRIPEVRTTTPSPIQKAKTRADRLIEAENGIVNDSVETGIVLDDNGKELFRQSTGNSGEVKFTTAQLRKLPGTTVTHNHPVRTDGGLGGNFSEADLGFFASNQLKEIRAVDTEFVYKVTGSIPRSDTKGLKRAATRMYNKVYKQYSSERIEFQRINGRPATRAERDAMLWERTHKEMDKLTRRWGLNYERIKRNADGK